MSAIQHKYKSFKGEAVITFKNCKGRGKTRAQYYDKRE